MAKIWIGAALLALPAMALANGRNAAANYFEELPVVLTASRLKQTAAEAPSAVTVIDREMIVASGARQIVELLRLVPGFHIGYTNGNSPVAGYHGLSDAYARRMQVLVDGVSIYSPLYGGVDWNEVPVAIQDIERIEVVRGPNAVTYGANAFLGVINIITRDPATEPRFQAEINAGGAGVRDGMLHVAQQGEGWRYRVTAGQRNDSGFDNLPDGSRIDMANLRAHYRVGAVDELALQLRTSRGTKGEGYYDLPANDAGRMHARDIVQNTLQLRWTRAQSADEESWIQYFHHDQNPREAVGFLLMVPSLPPIPYAINYNYDLRRDDIEFQQVSKPSDTLRTLWGGQWRRDSARSQTFFHSDAWLNSDLTRLFGNVEWRPIDRVVVHGGAMFEHDSNAGNTTSPRLAGTWTVSPGHTLRFAVSRANRAPTLFEDFTNQTYDAPPVLAPFAHGLPLKITYLSSGNLRCEKILSREIGYVAEIPQYRLSGDVRWFRDRIDSLIYGTSMHPVVTLLNKTPAIDFINSPQVVHERGVEASGRWQPWSGASLLASASYTRVESDMADTVQSAPAHTRSLLYSQTLPWDLSLSAGYYQVAGMRWQNSPFAISAYETLDLRVARQFRWGEQRAEVALVTRNMLGPYHEYNLVNFDRRYSYLQLKIAY